MWHTEDHISDPSQRFGVKLTHESELSQKAVSTGALTIDSPHSALRERDAVRLPVCSVYIEYESVSETPKASSVSLQGDKYDKGCAQVNKTQAFP